MSPWWRVLLLLSLLLMVGTTEAWFRKHNHAENAVVKKTGEDLNEAKKPTPPHPAHAHKEDDDEFHTMNLFRWNWSLTKFVGSLVWKGIEPHKWWFRFLGIKLKEDVVVSLFVLVANMAYSGLALLGFWFFPTNFMLVVVLLTMPCGPAAVLVFFGILGAVAFFAAQFPTIFVACVWVSWFVKSRVFQNLGRRWRLDIDGDGQIDICDFLRHAALNEWTGSEYYQAIYNLLKKHRSPSEQQIDLILAILKQLLDHHGLQAVDLSSTTGQALSPSRDFPTPPPIPDLLASTNPTAKAANPGVESAGAQGSLVWDTQRLASPTGRSSDSKKGN